MNNIKNTFTIKDMENLSGIKAHTIRIWEKRYNVLEPMRTDTNIRLYDVSALQKLLNIVLLNDYGYKIAKISKLEPEKISSLVNQILSEKNAKDHAVSVFKMAMMNYDQTLFFNTYTALLSEKSFKEIFKNVFIPLIEEVGLLWQTDTITPAHEHFISYLIKQKLISNIEKIQMLNPTRHDKVFVLYLPHNEIHELGLLYINYELLLNGYKTIYLGESVPISSLVDLKKRFDNIVFVSYVTVEPSRNEINNYVNEVIKEVLGPSSEFWFIGRMTKYIDKKNYPNNISIFNSIQDLIEKL